LFGQVTYSEQFLRDYAGPIVSDPKVAVAELIANAHDAGARRVLVNWSKGTEDQCSVADDGTGLTKDEFLRRWGCLGYQRTLEQGEFAEFPPGVRFKGRRPAFGQNGKGRFAPFCFADEYQIQTTKAGDTTRATVSLGNHTDRPFIITDLTVTNSSAQAGTIVSWKTNNNKIRDTTIIELVQSIFLLDPQFVVEVNGNSVDLSSLDGMQRDVLKVPPHGSVTVYQVSPGDTRKHNRPGITWRVHSRLVGAPTWHEFDGTDRFPDGKPDDARNLCFIVEADFLKPSVKPDWSGFRDGQPVVATKDAVFDFVKNSIQILTRDSRKKRKATAIAANQAALRELPRLSVDTIARFIEDVSASCPRLTQKELNTTVAVLAKLEQTRSCYDLLNQLEAMTPDDLDTWNSIMKSWDASHAQIILDLIDRRLKVIERLERISAKHTTDEVHELLPIFTGGLWIFGPEFESPEFIANRSITTVIREFLRKDTKDTIADRPDIVALPTKYVLPFTMNGFGADHEVGGIDRLLILELKRGGFEIDQEDCNQAMRYIHHLKKNGHISKSVNVTAFVLGWHVAEDTADQDVGSDDPKARIRPKPYSYIISRAKARLFNLSEKVKKLSSTPQADPEVELAFQNAPSPMFT
jgi:hypothetical protein